jgi:hypothetical protein
MRCSGSGVTRPPLTAPSCPALERHWRQAQLPRYRQLVASATAALEHTSPPRLLELVDELGQQAGIALWYPAILGGPA